MRHLNPSPEFWSALRARVTEDYFYRFVFQVQRKPFKELFLLEVGEAIEVAVVHDDANVLDDPACVSLQCSHAALQELTEGIEVFWGSLLVREEVQVFLLSRAYLGELERCAFDRKNATGEVGDEESEVDVD